MGKILLFRSCYSDSFIWLLHLLCYLYAIFPSPVFKPSYSSSVLAHMPFASCQQLSIVSILLLFEVGVLYSFVGGQFFNPLSFSGVQH